MRSPVRLRGRVVALMATEEGGQAGTISQHRLHPRHDSAPEGARHFGRLCRRGESALDHERMNALAPLDRRHHSETEEATVSDDQWSCGRRVEGDLHVPESLLRKTRARRKCLHAFALGLERLALHPDHLPPGSYPPPAEGPSDPRSPPPPLPPTPPATLRF